MSNRHKLVNAFKKLNGKSIVDVIPRAQSNNSQGGEIYCRLCSCSTWIGVGSIRHDEECPAVKPLTIEEQSNE